MNNVIFYEINGKKYEGATSFQATDSVVEFGKSFLITVTVTSEITPSLLNISTQDEIKIFIDDNLILTGFIINKNISYDSSSHIIAIEGADKATDLIDSNIVQKSYKIRNFPKLINQVLKDNGYNLKIINNVINLPLLSEKEEIHTENQETIIDFLFRYAQKVQVLLTTNQNGDIVITREDKFGNIGNATNELNGTNNNIISASFTDSTKDRFNIVEIFSQDTNEFHTEQASNQKGHATDNEIRSPRRKRVIFSNPTKTKFLNDYAKWFINIKKAKGKKYNIKLQGYYGKSLWRSNNLIKVKDDFTGLNGEFLIEGVSYSKSINGSFTDLIIVEKGSLGVDPSLFI